MYKAGTITLTHGSTTVVGINTEFLKYVGSGDVLKNISGVTTYVIDRVVSETALLLNTPYQGTSVTGVPYVIISDKNPYLVGFQCCKKEFFYVFFL